MWDVEGMLADVRALADRGDHHSIVSRYGSLDDMPERETWNSTELLYEIGRAFGMLGNEEKVERYLLRCAELAPRRAAVFHCAIGWYFQRKKKWSKALRWYDRALDSFPTYHLCLFRTGYCLEKLHRPREALDALSRACAVWEVAGSEQRIRGRGVQVQVLFHLARVMRDVGSFDEAAEVLETCAALDRECDPPAIRPEHIAACRGELALRRGDLDSALGHFADARELDEYSSYLWERTGRVLELQGDVKGAEAAYRHATGLARGAFAQLALGRLHTQVTGRYDEAVEAFAAALQEVPGVEPLVRIELARLHLACDRPTAAYQQLEHALACRREGGFLEALRLAAEVAERLHRFDEARGFLEEILRASPDDADAQRHQAQLESASRPATPPPADKPLPPALAILERSALLGRGRERVRGIVDRFFTQKGFGFVRYGEGETLFFHVTQCEDDTADLLPGTRVSFIVGHNAKKGKPQAESLRMVAHS
jgi:tetratricopeptide (TPR) repeat protein/cold shock CspA family protein